MVEAIMYFGIGFLLATLIALSVIPMIHGRAVRLTTRRIEKSLPQSMAEIQADKDLQRADFAVSTRRLEITIEQLKESNTSQRAEIGRKDDIINRFKVERDVQNVELLLLKAEVSALKQQIGRSDIRLNIEQDRPHEFAAISAAPADLPLPEAAQTRLVSPQLRIPPDRFPWAALLATKDKDSGADSVAEPILAKKPPALTDQNDRSDTSLVPSADIEVEADTPAAEISVDGRMPPGRETIFASRNDASIHVSPGDHFVQEQPRQGIRPGSITLVTALIGLTVFVWVYHENALTMLATWTRAIMPSPPTSAANVIRPQSEENAASPALPSQLESLTPEVATMRNNVEQPAARQEQLNGNNEPAQRGQEAKEARLNPAAQPQPKPEPRLEPRPETGPEPKSGPGPEPRSELRPGSRLAPVPETPPTTIPGWIVREVANGTAVVQGPTGNWRVARGDVLPGAGRVESIVRWGNRWIVATNRGLISTP